MSPTTLTALPVYNEVGHVAEVLAGALGYGSALRSAFAHALAENYDVLVTI